MRNHFISLLALFFHGYAIAQEESIIPKVEPIRVYDGNVEFQKTTQHAKIFDFKYPAAELETAISNYLTGRGAKVKKEKGFNYVKAIQIHKADDKYFDVYYKVEGKGKRDAATSTLYIILAEPGEDILQRTSGEVVEGRHSAVPAVVATVGAVSFFDELGTHVGRHSHARSISSYSEEVKKAEKKYNSLMTESRSLARKKEKLEKQIAQNAKDIEQQAREVEKSKTVLKQLQERNN